MFEIEFRAEFNKERFDELKKYLDAHAKNLGDDDKDCYYYIFSDKLLKLVHNTSQKTAKIFRQIDFLRTSSIIFIWQNRCSPT